MMMKWDKDENLKKKLFKREVFVLKITLTLIIWWSMIKCLKQRRQFETLGLQEVFKLIGSVLVCLSVHDYSSFVFCQTSCFSSLLHSHRFDDGGFHLSNGSQETEDEDNVKVSRNLLDKPAVSGDWQTKLESTEHQNVIPLDVQVQRIHWFRCIVMANSGQHSHYNNLGLWHMLSKKHCPLWGDHRKKCCACVALGCC